MKILAVKACNVKKGDLLRVGKGGFRRIRTKVNDVERDQQATYFIVRNYGHGLAMVPFVSGDYVVVKRPKKNYTRKYQ